MLKELYDAVIAQAHKSMTAAGRVGILELPGCREKRVIDAGGRLEAYMPDFPRRNHVLHSVAEIGPLRELFADGRIVVWVGREAVTVILNDQDYRDDRVVCPFEYTDEFALLSGLREQEFGQKALIRLLRCDLAAAATESSQQLLQVVKVISTKVLATGHGNFAEKNRSSMGKDIEAEVVSDRGDIPDLVRFRTRVFKDPALLREYEFTCQVEIEPQTQTFMLLPNMREIEQAEFEQRQRVRELLAETQMQVFLGEPSP